MKLEEMDDRLRKLERAALNDPTAKERLKVEMLRAGKWKPAEEVAIELNGILSIPDRDPNALHLAREHVSRITSKYDCELVKHDSVYHNYSYGNGMNNYVFIDAHLFKTPFDDHFYAYIEGQVVVDEQTVHTLDDGFTPLALDYTSSVSRPISLILLKLFDLNRLALDLWEHLY